MPLTAFSSSRKMELDPEQLMGRLEQEYFQSPLAKGDPIPEVWKAHISTDLECPSCFSRGAELVRAGRSKTDGHTVRQAYFRFTQGAGSGHHPFCDFSGGVPAGFVPENLIQFSSAKDVVSRAVRDLVCKGLAIEVFSQWDIRAMREWFFNQKLAFRFTVTLDPRLPAWLESIQAVGGWHVRPGLEGLTLTRQIVSVPGFDYMAAARRDLLRRYRPHLQYLSEQKIYLSKQGGRLEKLATEFHGKQVFDPAGLRNYYELTQALAEFICCNHAPLSRSVKSYAPLETLKNPRYVLAFAALLLFKSGWDINTAVDIFAQIASSSVAADTSLGNVMGLNPFHDYAAWAALKALQKLPPFEIPAVDAKTEMDTWIQELKSSFGL